ncbi:MAG: 8-amino-7-oxononanoate synthase [bacterium]
MEKIKGFLDFINNDKLYPNVRRISGCPTDPEVMIDGKKFLMFCSNDYLGLANSDPVKRAAHEAIDKYGIGSGGSRLMSGNTDIQIKLEETIARFKGGEAAITFSTGYMANTGAIPAVVDVLNLKKIGSAIIKAPTFRKNIILSDELNHASIIDGCRLTHAKRVVYKHKDMVDLEKKLKKYKRYRKLIITDGVFSMDGDIAPLPRIVELAKKYNAMTFIDDAHASGTLGKNGRGTIDHFNLKEDDVDIMMGTFTKSFGGVGGFIVGKKELIDFLRITVRTYIFSAPIPPVISAALVAAIEEAEKNSSYRENLWANVTRLKDGLNKAGFNTLSSETQIIPVLVGDEKKCEELSSHLFEEGILASCVRWPAVPWGKARLRITVKANHTKEQIDRFLMAIEKLGKEMGIIK